MTLLAWAGAVAAFVAGSVGIIACLYRAGFFEGRGEQS